MARVTLSTIAEMTGLSKFAVSRSLSGKDGVSDETRRRVQQVAAELGYARAAAEVEAPVLGVVFHDTDLVNSELHLLIQSGFQTEAQRSGYQVRMCWTHLTDEVVAFARGCRAVAMVGPHPRQSMEAIRALGLPVARQGWVDPLEPVDTVSGTDHEAGSAVATTCWSSVTAQLPMYTARQAIGGVSSASTACARCLKPILKSPSAR